MTADSPSADSRVQDAKIAERSPAFPFRVGDRVEISGYVAGLYARPQHWRSLVGTVTEASREPYSVSVRRDTQMGVRRWHVSNLKLRRTIEEIEPQKAAAALAVLTEARND